MGTIRIESRRIIYSTANELVHIEPWGQDAIRFRSSPLLSIEDRNWTLLAPEETAEPEISFDGRVAHMRNGTIAMRINIGGSIGWYNHQNKRVLREVFDDMPYEEGYVPSARMYKSLSSDGYKMSVEFLPEPGERLYGAGQYANDLLDLKGTSLDLIQLNQQTSVPVIVSSFHYALIWNNPATGRLDLCTNITRISADVTKQIDYIMVGGTSIAQVVSNATRLTGRPPEMPEAVAGYWQCKLRYWNQQQVLEVAREHNRRNIPLDIIVIDFFHWTRQGEYRFDSRYWPDPKSMIDELHEMGIKVMVSVWPTVSPDSEHYAHMFENNMLIRPKRGLGLFMEFAGTQGFIDVTNPATRAFVWAQCKKNYVDIGVDMFWLDESEPEIRPADFDNVRYHLGDGNEVTNIYPYYYSKLFTDGFKSIGVENPVHLTRCAWLGSQRLGSVVWSGDVVSSFDMLRKQLKAGLNIGLCGISWWTTDIGGFFGLDRTVEADRELLIRWFQWGAFCPVMRMHGWRKPYDTAAEGDFGSGGDNEVWSYGLEAGEILERFIHIRTALKPYVLEQMQYASHSGNPVMRPLFHDFEDDTRCFDIDDQFLFGSELLVAPVLTAGARSRQVYLPAGCDWVNVWSGSVFDGGSFVESAAPLAQIPIFLRKGSKLDRLVFKQ